MEKFVIVRQVMMKYTKMVNGKRMSKNKEIIKHIGIILFCFLYCLSLMSALLIAVLNYWVAIIK